MGANNIMDDDMDFDEMRYDRENRNNPPEFAYGQSDDFDIFSSDFDTPVSGNDFSSFGSNSGNGFFGNGGGMFVNNGGTLGNNTMQQQPTEVLSSEEKIFQGMANACKGIGKFIKSLYSSFNGLTPKFFSIYGKNVAIVGGVCTIVGLISGLFKLGFWSNLMISGLLSSSVGVVVLMFNIEKASSYTSQYYDSNTMVEQPSNEISLGTENQNNDNDFFNNPEPSFDFDSGDEDEYDCDDYDEYSYDSVDSEDTFDFNSIDLSTPVAEDTVSTEDALNSLPDIDKGTYTRQYLYEMFSKVLPTIKPDFSTVKNISSDDNLFLAWESKLQEACKVVGMKDEDLPELLELNENLFTIKLVCSRTKGLKPELVADELAKLYAYDINTGSFNEKVYATAVGVGLKCIITVFTGETAMVSLKDTYAHIKDSILDTKNYMPVVLGIDQTGKVIWTDFKYVESCIVAGMPRTGKSWIVQAILTQMCAYLSPSELNFYICDAKENTSDFSKFTLPHVKKFATRYKTDTGVYINKDGQDIVSVLRNIVEVEAPRRKKILGDAGCVNIWDFKQKHPDVKLPLLYVIIDEVVSLSEGINADDKREYLSYITQLITQFPNLGIRMILIPHVVKNDIIKKTATDTVKCRISVCGDANHIESSTGTKPKDFNYKLTNTGDMAVRMHEISPNTLYVHGVALTTSNEGNNDLFEYLRKVWGKLEPEDSIGDITEKAEQDEFTESLLRKLDEDDEINLFDNDDNNTINNTIEEEVPIRNINTKKVSSMDDDFLARFK